MSIRAMNWAWEQKIAPAPKLILMALADSANDSDECWPGISFIAEKCCVSERTVQRVFQKFEAVGLMAVKSRYTSAGRQTSNRYRLNIDSSPDKLSPPRQLSELESNKLSGAGATPDVTGEGGIAMSPLEPPEESIQQPLQYPPQLSPAERETMLALLITINQVDAQALLDELSDALECKTIKTNALRWFRALVARHKSGVFIPVGGIRIAERRSRQKQELQAKQIACQPRSTDRDLARNSLAQVKRMITIPDFKAGNGYRKKPERD